MRSTRIMISGGGTGGHIFPAIAIANALRRIEPTCEILFVGAAGRMEMDRVPAAGYKIVGLNISGIQRGAIWKNLSLPFKVISSLRTSKQLLSEFKPDVVVGVGGYASGPLLYAASMKGIPYLIQEQNSFAGITNKLLSKKAAKICVAFEGMDEFFPANKVLITGNPVRTDVINVEGQHHAGATLLKLDPLKKIVLVTGGSLGARTLNTAVENGLDLFVENDVQVIWQTGKFYFKDISARVTGRFPGIVVVEFLHKMDLAYAAADVIISRAGAGTIAELCIIKKPVILVPSPNVAEDHQTKNALALVKNNAAVMVADSAADEILVETSINLLNDEEKCKKLSNEIGKMALPDADIIIAKEVLKLAGGMKWS